MSKVGKVLAIVGLVGGAGAMMAPLAMGQSIVRQEVSSQTIKGEKFTLKALELTAKKGAILYSKPDTSSKELFTFKKKSSFSAKGYSDEYVVVDYQDGNAFIHLADLDAASLKELGLKAPKKATTKKKEVEPLFSEATIKGLEELGIDLEGLDTSDVSLYDKETLDAYREAVIAYGRALKVDSSKDYPELKEAMEEAKGQLAFKDGKLVFPPKEEVKESSTSSSSSSTNSSSSSSAAPSSSTAPSSSSSAAPAPQPSRDASKFQFPSVPEGLEVVDGKTLANVSIEAETMTELDAKTSPNFSVGTSVTKIPAGTKVHVTKLSTDGFAKVNYNGQDVYVDASNLR